MKLFIGLESDWVVDANNVCGVLNSLPIFSNEKALKMAEVLLSEQPEHEMNYQHFCKSFIEMFDQERKTHQMEASDLGFTTPAHQIVDMLKDLKSKYVDGPGEEKELDRKKIFYAIEKLNAKQSLYSIDIASAFMTNNSPQTVHDHSADNQAINEEIRK